MIKTKNENQEICELEKFASFFHQDFCLLFSSMAEGVESYVSQLNAFQKKELKSQLQSFLADWPGEDQKGLLNAWHRSGAQWSEKKMLRQNLKNTIEWLE